MHPLYLLTRYLKATGDNCDKLYKILDDHAGTFQIAKGSQFNHQTWPGGYLQHVADCMSIARMFLNAMPKGWPVPFSWSSVVLVIFLHDIDKPFMQRMLELKSEQKPWPKQDRFAFQLQIISKYDIQVTSEELIALKYIEGEGLEYDNYRRKMNELGAFCHAADVLSARLWHSRNKPNTTPIDRGQ